MREHARLWVAGARAMRTISTLAALALAGPAFAGPCVARSGERTAALVELYTGARCAGCPAADRWLADLAGLARHRLAARGVRRISGGQWCTAGDAARFYSFRRDGTTGRMAAAVWIAARVPPLPALRAGLS